jgi:hypothetical protein
MFATSHIVRMFKIELSKHFDLRSSDSREARVRTKHHSGETYLDILVFKNQAEGHI